MTYTEDEAKEIVKIHSEVTEKWVKESRIQSKTLRALVTGEGFQEELVERIEHLESHERIEVRRKYSKDIRDLFSRLMKKRQNVFDANGGSENSDITNETIKELFDDRIANFKANKSLYKYLSENFFQLTDIDPNGVMMLEYKDKMGSTTDEKVLYPSYKSIDDIRYYKPNGQLVEYIVFEPKEKKESGAKIWRMVDDKTDWTFLEMAGSFMLIPDKTFEHPFGKVPCVILSERCVVGSDVRLSPIHDVVELSKDYARDKSVLTIYKFQKGVPFHYRYGEFKCKPCSGLGKTGNDVCSSCGGKGTPKKADVSDVFYVPLPKEGQPFLGDKLMGFSSPDLETWTQYKQDLRDMELLIEDTIWGTDRAYQRENNKVTATEVVIDMQPVTNTLSIYSDVVEHVYNTLANFTLNFVDIQKDKEENIYHLTFGRRYIIESPDVLMEKYGKAKAQGDNNTILDKLLEELILSKYKSDPYMQSRMLKKAKVEPYIHLSIKEVFDYFGKVESNKKVLFQKFWLEADKDKDFEQLTLEFDAYFVANNTIQLEVPVQEVVS